MNFLPRTVPNSVSLSSEAPTAVVLHLRSQGMHRLYIDGDVTIQGFLAAALIGEITITTIPVLVGTGRPLFGTLPSDMHLDHVSTGTFDFGFVQSKYWVVNLT